MPNVDDHGLEVLKKAARNIGDVPKKDYALQTWIVGTDAVAPALTAQNLTVEIPSKDTEVQIDLPASTKAFVLKARKNSRLRLAFAENGTNTNFVTIPLGGYWDEKNKLTTDKVFVQSSIDDNIIEIVVYT